MAILQPHQKLLVAGVSNKEATWRSTPEILAELGMDPNDSRIHFQPTARNTKDQSIWIVETAHELNIASFAVSVASYHIVRSFMTDLATLHDYQLDTSIAMFPFPTTTSPLESIPETKLTMGESYEGELRRIETYAKAGHVATWSQLYAYLTNVTRNYIHER